MLLLFPVFLRNESSDHLLLNRVNILIQNANYPCSSALPEPRQLLQGSVAVRFLYVTLLSGMDIAVLLELHVTNRTSHLNFQLLLQYLPSLYQYLREVVLPVSCLLLG